MSEQGISGRDIVVIGASAGGLEALKQLVSRLPHDLAAALFVVIHYPSFAMSYLPDILNRVGKLHAAHAIDGEPIAPGRIYVAPVDNHLLVEDGVVRVWHGPKENHSRPAIDPLFRSAATSYGERVAGVILSGTLRDGTAGLIAVKENGGVSITQDPEDALFPGMPENAIKFDNVDHSLPAADIAALITRLSEGQMPTAEPNGRKQVTRYDKAVTTMAVSSWDRVAEKIVTRDTVAQIDGERSGKPSVYSCPECGGVMWQIDEGEVTLFRCHVGHVYNAEDMLRILTEVAETAMWLSARILADQAVLGRQMAAKERGHSSEVVVTHFENVANTAEQQSAVIRRLIQSSAMMTAEAAAAEKAEATED